MGGWASVVLEEGPLPRRPPALPLGRPLFHLGRQDAGHHTWASGDRSRETTRCTQHIWKLFKVYFLTHLQESGHLHRGFAGWREPRGFSQVGAVFGPRGEGLWGGERKVEAWSWQMPEARSSLLRSNWLPGTETGPASLPLGYRWYRAGGSSCLLQPAAFSGRCQWVPSHGP